MKKTLYWLQCGACGGDSMSLLDLESPDLAEFLQLLDIEVLWHPSMSNGSPAEHRRLLDNLVSGRQALDVLCVEGSIIRGPGGTGMYDTFEGGPDRAAVREALLGLSPYEGVSGVIGWDALRRSSRAAGAATVSGGAVRHP